MRATLHGERGSILVTTLVLTMVMLTVGLSLLALVDVQGTASVRQRQGDTALNLAESALAATTFVLGSDWPETPSPGRPWTQVATCGQQRIGGGVSPTADASSTAGRIERVVARGWAARSGSEQAAWSVNICDAGAAGAWSPALLARPPYDATGRRTKVQPDGTTIAVRQLWVRATGTVDGRTRTVASLVQTDESPAFPSGYGVLAGRMGFINGLNSVTDSILGDKTALGTLTQWLLGTSPMITGKVGIRCGLLTHLCLDSISSTLTTIPLLDQLGVTNGQVVQYGSATATAPGGIDQLRRRAASRSAYVESVADGAPCVPAGTSVSATSVVFVEQVGDGAGTCVIPADTDRAIGTVVVGRGRMRVTPPAKGTATLTGVLYALNRQDEKLRDVIRIDRNAKVRGAVFADQGGIVSVSAPNFSLSAAICESEILGWLCFLAPVTGLLDLVLDVLGVNQLLTVLLPQLNATGPVITYDPAVVSQQVVFGSSGAVQHTFHQVNG